MNILEKLAMLSRERVKADQAVLPESEEALRNIFSGKAVRL